MCMLEVWAASMVIGMATNGYVQRGKKLGWAWGEGRQKKAREKVLARAGEDVKGTSWWVGLGWDEMSKESQTRFPKGAELTQGRFYPGGQS